MKYAILLLSFFFISCHPTEPTCSCKAEKEIPSSPLIWEQIKATSDGWETDIIRIRVPDGWLVRPKMSGSSTAYTFVPDAAHIWSGR